MMQPQINSNSAVPITSAAGINSKEKYFCSNHDFYFYLGIINFDQYKYVRNLLPSVPHFIESLIFTDLSNWECQVKFD